MDDDLTRLRSLRDELINSINKIDDARLDFTLPLKPADRTELTTKRDRLARKRDRVRDLIKLINMGSAIPALKPYTPKEEAARAKLQGELKKRTAANKTRIKVLGFLQGVFTLATAYHNTVKPPKPTE